MKLSRPLAAISVAAFVLGIGAAIPASAAPTLDPNRDTGTLTVHKYSDPGRNLAHDGTEIDLSTLEAFGNKAIPGVKFTATPVASCAGTELGSPKTQGFWSTVATECTDTVYTLSTTTVYHGLTDSDGQIAQWFTNEDLTEGPITNLPLGLYRIEETGQVSPPAPEGITAVQPFFVTIPVTAGHTTSDLEASRDWNYNVHVYPKNHVPTLEKISSGVPVSAGDLITYTITGTKPLSVQGEGCYYVNESDALVLVPSVSSASACTTYSEDNEVVTHWKVRTVTTMRFTDELQPGLILPNPLTLTVTFDADGPDGAGTAQPLVKDTHYSIEVDSSRHTVTVTLLSDGLALVNDLATADDAQIVITFIALVDGTGIEGEIHNTAVGTYIWDDDESTIVNEPSNEDTVYFGGERLVKMNVSNHSETLEGAEFMVFNACVPNVEVHEYEAGEVNCGLPRLETGSSYSAAQLAAAKKFYATQYQNANATGKLALEPGHTDATHPTYCTDPASSTVAPEKAVCFYTTMPEGTPAAFTSPRVFKASTDALGMLLINGINWDGTIGRDMVVLETKAPANYELLVEPIIITINSDIGEYNVEGNNYDWPVYNAQANGGFEIPLTGSTGSTFLTVAGLVGFVTVVILTSRKRQAA